MWDHDASWGVSHKGILHPWVVLVGAHGHQRVGCRSADWWDPETSAAMHCNEAALWHCTALHGIARDWRARQDAAVWCPLSPHCPCSPATPPTHTGEIACLSDPEHISLTLPELNPLLFPAKVASQSSMALNIHKANSATFPSSQWRGG